MKANKSQIFVWLLIFGLSRIWVVAHPPYHKVSQGDTVAYEGYSDVKHDYERYANMWKYGLTPYYEHLYEYPPATIPLVYLPLEIDLAGLGHYYQNYRILVSLLELVFFVGLVVTLYRFHMSSLIRNISLLFYLVAGMWAKDYWYEGLDLIFSMSLTAAILLRYLSNQRVLISRVLFWSFFWLSTAIKFMTIPLALPFFLINRGSWKQEMSASILGLLIIWALPLAYFRTALSVSVVFHLGRPLKYGSLGTLIIKTINDFTQTEIQTDILPHLPMAGPVTNVVEHIFSLVFPLAILLVIGGMSLFVYKHFKSYRTEPLLQLALSIKISLIYFFILFLTTKVFSSPFHIWYVPLIALFPFSNIRQQLVVVFSSLWMLGMDTTSYFKVSTTAQIGKLSLEHIRDWFRFAPMLVMLLLAPMLKPISAKLIQPEIGVSKA